MLILSWLQAAVTSSFFLKHINTKSIEKEKIVIFAFFPEPVKM